MTKQTWGAFHRTPLDTLLRDRGVTQIVLTGVATSAGVESTARSAHEHGYHVVLATDAMTDRDPDLHEHSVQRIFPRLGETATTRRHPGHARQDPVAGPAPPRRAHPYDRRATPQYPQREPSLSARPGSSQPHRPR